MPVVLKNRAYVSTATTGTGTLTLGSPISGYQSFADAGVSDGDTVRYTIEDGANFEIGEGVYTATGTTLSRTPSESSNSGSAINLSGGARVFIAATAEDLSSNTITLDSKTTAYTVTTDDLGKIIHATGDGTFTVTIPTASAAGTGFNVKIWNTGDGTITVTGGGVIDGGSLTSRVLYAWEGFELVSTGSVWYSGSTKSTRYYAENGNDGNTTRPIASGTYSIALGGTSTASGTASLAVGLGTTASATASNAIGRGSFNIGAVAAGSGAVALGGAHAGGADAISAGIGNNNTSYGAIGANSIAFGQLVKATGANSVSIGDNSTASNTSAIAIGSSVTSSGLASVALGNSSASGQSSFTAGQSNTASGNYSVALGNNAQATGAYSVSIGYGILNSTANLIMIGGSTGPDTVKISNAYTLPTSDGTADQVLSTDGSGALSFVDQAGADLYAANESSPAAQPSATGGNAVAIGDSAVASGVDTIAIGFGATATGNFAASFGRGSASGVNSVALGRGTTGTSASDSFAMGQAIVTGSDSVALGQSRAGNTASFAAVITDNTTSYGAAGANSVAMGYRSKTGSSANGSISIGYQSSTSGSYSIAMGYQSDATQIGAVAAGYSATSSNAYTIAMGYFSTASGSYSIALGKSTTASGNYSTALGASSSSQSANATGSGSVAIGGALASGDNSTAINIGSSSSNGATGTSSVAIGSSANASHAGAAALGYQAKAQNNYALALGDQALANGTNATAIQESYAGGTDGFAANITTNSSVYGAKQTNTIAIGKLAKAYANDAVAIGDTTIAGGANSLAMGNTSTATGSQSIAIGMNASSSQTYAVSFGGYYPTADLEAKYAFGSGYLGHSERTQTGMMTLGVSTTDATATALKTSNAAAGTTNQVILPNNSAYAFHGTIVARESATDGTDCAAWKVEGLIRREGTAGTTVLVNSATTVLDNTPSWGMALSADTTNGGLAITVTGAAATNIRWVATIHTSEVTYA